MRYMKTIVVAIAALFGLQALAEGNTWYVDDANYGKPGMDGTKPETAYGTIQDAIDAADTKAGDTILVLPGVYDKGEKSVDESGNIRKVRVYVTKANLTIRATSTRGPDDTHIVGRFGSGAGGLGDDAVSCVRVSGRSCVLDGFTLRNGSVSSAVESGSAYMGRNYSDRDDHLVNCVVSNCVAKDYVLFDTSAHRCKFLFNRGGVARYSNLENCLAGYEDGDASGSHEAVRNCTVVNCTVAGALHRGFGSGVEAYNSISALNWANRDDVGCKFYSSLAGVWENCGPDLWSVFEDSRILTNELHQLSVFVAPLFGDFRLLEGSPAIDFGKTEFLTKVPLPEGYEYRDLNGALIDTNAVTCHAGAVQEVVQPAGGRCVFKQNIAGRAKFLVNGQKPYASFVGNCGRGAYAYATAWPTQWCVTAIAPDVNPLSCVSDSSGYSHFATRTGRVYVTPPRATGESKTLTAECATDIFYVDPVNGSDAFDGSCAWADADAGANKGPWRTLMYASTNDAVQIATRILIRCAPGLYAEGDSGNASSRARVAVSASSADTKDAKRGLHFAATSATELTAIVGAPDPESTYEVEGCGSNALRCIYNSAPGTGFTGFALTNGYSNVDVNYQQAGGCAYANGGTMNLSDCVLTGNGAEEGIVAGYAADNLFLSRCLIANNKARLGISCGAHATLCGCILRDNVITKANCGWFLDTKTLINCTLYVSEPVASDYVLEGSGKRLYNCIFVNTPNLKNAVVCRGSVMDNCTGTMTGFSNDCVKAAAFLARPSAGDFRLCADSAAWQTPVDDFDELANGLDTDYLGQPIIVGGKVQAAGAVMAAAEGCICIENGENRLSVTGRPSDANDIRSDETVTIAPNAATKRPVIGIVVNGVTNLFGTAASLSYAYADVAAAGGALSVQGVATSDWYVNPNTDPAKGVVGDDDNHGYSPEFPKRTLKGVASVATVSNDVIHAAAGVYDSETMNTVVPAQPSRVEMPSFVTLVSDEGCGKTVIRGAAGADANGFGTGAVRCVYLCKGATIRGFTCADGHMVTEDTSNTDAIHCGPGICAYRYDGTDAYVEDCIISNCVANYCVLLGGTYRRCEIVNNSAYVDGILGRGVLAYNTLVARNVVQTGKFCFRNSSFEGLTYAADNLGTDGKPRNDQGAWYSLGFVNNSLIYGITPSTPATNSVFVGSWSMRDKYVNCRAMSAEDVALDENYRPIFGISPLIDAGTNDCQVVANYDTWGGRDLDGNPRVSNGVIDIGAYEADWRPVYSARLGRDVTVAEASPSVVTNGAGGVSLGADGTLALDWALGGLDGRVLFDVTGSGTLTVSRNGTVEATFTSASDPKVYAFRPEDAADQRLAFAYTPGEPGDGTAAILRCRRQIGMMLIVR